MLIPLSILFLGFFTIPVNEVNGISVVAEYDMATSGRIAQWENSNEVFFPSDFQPERFSFEFNGVTLDRALFEIAETTGLEIVYESYLTEGETVNAHYQDEPIRLILDQILTPAGLEAQRIRTGMFVIRFSLRRKIQPLIFPTTPEMTRSVFNAKSSSYWKVPASKVNPVQNR